MKLRSVAVALFAVFTFTVMAYFPYKNDRDTELYVRNHVVQINTIAPRGVYGCTGTLLSHNYVLTNAHCFPQKNATVFIRRINDNQFLPAVIVSSAPKTDYALLSFKGLDTSDQVSFTADWHLGEDIIIYGNPGYRAFVLGHSRIVSYLYVQYPMEKVRTMIAFPCNEGGPGFSGSGVYNLKGEYIGTFELEQEIPILYQIASRLAGEPRQEPLCFAIPAKEAIDRNLDRPWYGFDMGDK